MISNKSMGSAFEHEFCEILGKSGYWVHNMAQSMVGQPADVIAVRNGHTYLIDCKNCTNAYFDINRIEENQRNAMNLFESLGNGSGWFAVKFSSGIYMVPLWRLESAEKTHLPVSWFEMNSVTIEQWLRDED